MRLRRTQLVVAVAAAGFLAAACGGGGNSRVVAATPGTGATTAKTSVSASPKASSPAPSGSATPTPMASHGPGEGALRVLAISGYAEWGGTDPTVNWVKPFEEQTGCKVSLSFYDPGLEATPGGASLGPFDVVSATPEIAGRLIDEGTVAPINTALVEGYEKIPTHLRELPAYTEDDQVYGVPYLWGVDEVLYDATKGRPKDEGALFTGKGPVLLRDDPLTIADAALVLKRRGADIKDPFDLTPSQLDKAVDLITSNKSGERTFWRDPIDVVEGFASGSARLAQGTPYHLDVLKSGNKPVEALDGRPLTGWSDSWMVAAGAAHPSCAYQWLEWTASAQAQGPAAAWTGLAPANPAACTGDAKRVCVDYHVGDPAAFKGVYFAARPGDYPQWAERWTQIAHG
ncbi:extracellular solute-binding protein [Planotetraspora phitsanulokensis]|uniref:extracellular solute-binding protein n=1 Tax=Planotetraspora phitsanulokensis TaxID=575192 RepID=UPI00194F8097|nr:extracellular solute-binding protein [Planotetraspora phitsanulokensis]